MRKFKKFLAAAMVLAMLIGLSPVAAFADSAYGGTSDWAGATVSPAGIGPDGKSIKLAEGKAGGLAPTRGALVVGGTDGTYFRIMKTTTGGYVLFSADFSATSGTTDSEGANFAKTGGEDGTGVPRSFLTDTGGRLSTNIYSANFAGTTGTNVPAAGSLSSGKDPSGYLVPLNVDANGKLVLGASALTIGDITANAFTGTEGTTTGLGAKGVTINGLASGVPYSIAVDTSGHPQVDIVSLSGADFTGTNGTTDNLGAKRVIIAGLASGVPYSLDVDTTGRVILGASAQTIGNITATDFTGTAGTTDGLGTKGVTINGLASGVPYSLHVTSAGDLVLGASSATIGSVNILSGDFGVSDGSSTAPAKLMPIAGYTGSVFIKLLTNASGQLSVIAPEFTGTSGTTTGAGASIAMIGGQASSVPYVLNVDTSGRIVLGASSQTIGNITATDFTGTSGTTDNLGTKSVIVAGLTSGVPYSLAVDSSGRATVTLRATDPSGSNVSVKADAAGYLINAPAFPYSDGTSATANVGTTDSQTIVASSGTAYHTITGIGCSAGAAAGEIVVSIGGSAVWRKYAAANSSADSPPGLCYTGTLAQAVTITGPASYTYNLHYKTTTP